MTSDKDDQDNLDKDLDLGDSDDFIDDDYDPEGIDEPLSASILSSPEDYDQDSSDDFSNDDDTGDINGDDEEDVPPKKRSGGMAKIVAPLIVLLAAAGAGGYIVMNPSILGGSDLAAQIAAQPESASPVADTSATLTETPLLPTPEIPADVVTAEPPTATPETPPADTTVQPPADATSPELAANEIPPQPAANINEEQPVVAPADATTTESAATDATVTPAVTEEIPAAPADVPAPPADVPAPPAETAMAPVPPEPVEPAATPAPEEAAKQPETTTVASATETTPATEIPAAPATPPAAPETPPATEPVAPVASEVTQPTFVPAAPDQTQPVEMASADSAEPPVMNVKEVTGVKTPDMPPRTVEQAPPSVVPPPVNVGGNASAPISPLPAESANNAYYDSLSQVPSGAMAKSVGPREVNPVLEPASKMIIVSKDRSGDSQEAQIVSANRALKLKRYDAALEMFDQLYAKNKRDVRILMGRAIAQQNMGLNESAIQTYEEVLALKPNNAEALLNMLGLLRAQYPEIALRRLLDLYADYPNNPGIAAQIGITNASLGHYEDAMRYLGIASTLEPTNAQHLFNMAIAADRQGQAVKAIELYQRALEVDVMYGSSRSVPRERIYDRLSVLRRG